MFPHRAMTPASRVLRLPPLDWPVSWRAWQVLVIGAAALVAIAGFAAYPTHPSYDSLTALLWSRDVLDGSLPAFDSYRAPTQHPLLLVVGLPLAPLGEAGERIFVGLCIGSFVALVAAALRLGGLAAGVLGALVAAALVASRLNLALLAAIGFLDIPYCALIAWAAVLEAERPRRGGAVWALLALAGLLRPEAWLFAGLYALWIGAPRYWAPRLRAAALAAIAPVLWALTDLVVMGDPLFSLLHTDGLAAELQRDRSLIELPEVGLRLLDEIVKWPVLVLGAAGMGLALLRRRRELLVPAVLVVATCFSYGVIATGGLATVYRYLLLAALGWMVFAAYAVAGFDGLDRASPWRARWAAAAVVMLAGAAAFTVLTVNPEKVTAELDQRRGLRTELDGLLAEPAVRAALRCGPITVPNHKLIPEVRWLTELPEGRVRARSDRSRPPARSGVAIVIDSSVERRPALNVAEVRADGRGILGAPLDFRRLAETEHFYAYGSCFAGGRR